jgi:hypothetical protein
MVARKHRPPPASRLSPSLLSVYDGQVCVGHLIRRGKAGVEAFGADDVSLGIFASETLAANAISAREVCR